MSPPQVATAGHDEAFDTAHDKDEREFQVPLQGGGVRVAEAAESLREAVVATLFED